MKRNTKVPTLVLSVLLMFLFLIGCDPSAKETMDFYQNTKSIDLSTENINSISINSNEKDIITTFGKPTDVKEIENPKSKYLSYDGIEFGLKGNKVVRYYFNNNYETIKEIKIGDTKEKVIKVYGQNYYERVEGGIQTVGYFDKNSMINIEFGFNENKVEIVIIQKIGWREGN